jgi:hypothetical protein
MGILIQVVVLSPTLPLVESERAYQVTDSGIQQEVCQDIGKDFVIRFINDAAMMNDFTS